MLGNSFGKDQYVYILSFMIPSETFYVCFPLILKEPDYSARVLFPLMINTLGKRLHQKYIILQYHVLYFFNSNNNFTYVLL